MTKKEKKLYRLLKGMIALIEALGCQVVAIHRLEQGSVRYELCMPYETHHRLEITFSVALEKIGHDDWWCWPQTDERDACFHAKVPYQVWKKIVNNNSRVMVR